MKFAKGKTATAIALFLMFTMALSLVALPTVNAQQLIMNVPTEVLIHSEVDIDLNGGPGAYQDVELWITYPDRPDFTYIGTYQTRSNGDLDVYDFDFNETGIFKLQWRLPAPSTEVSNIVDVKVVTEFPPFTTYAFIGAAPNPVGVGQETILHIGITTVTANVALGWKGLSVKITRPDGTTETLTDITTDATGGTGRIYTPDIAGNYTFQTHFPEQLCPATVTFFGTTTTLHEGTKMLASDSPILTLVVTDEPLPDYPGIPLPTEYWTRPINAQLREWTVIAGNWPGASERDLTGSEIDAPETGHILWTKELSTGGLVGGEMMGINGPGIGFETGAAYEQFFGAPCILAGKLYYNRFQSRGGDDVEQEVVCVDLHTGEEIWVRNWGGERLMLGQIFYWESYNYMGAAAYLWTRSGSTWKAYEALSGRWIYTMEHVPASTGSYGGALSNGVWGPRGEIYSLDYDLEAGWICLWNSSRVVSNQGSWRPHGNTYDCVWTAPRQGGWEWNKTITDTTLTGSIRSYVIGDRAIGSDVSEYGVSVWGISLKEGSEGQVLFKNTWNAPRDWLTGNQTISWVLTSLEDDVGIVRSKEQFCFWGFSLKDGTLLWGPSEPEQYLHYLGSRTLAAYGNLYSAYMSGIIYCYDIQTGQIKWTVSASDPYNEILWSPNFPMNPQFTADGKLYLVYGEHSPNIPLPRGGYWLCLNATTGEEIWRLNGMYYYRTYTCMGDGIIAYDNSFDGQIYAIGKGASATSVTVQDDIVTLGDSVLVKGMVTDISPGTQKFERTVRFPHGVPAVSEDSMTAWMEYVYMQFPRPTNATGVDVDISVLDPNGNCYSVGTATSDAGGLYSFAFTPEVPGKYTIIASFAGHRGYYGSFDETAINVEDAPEATPAPTPTPAPMTDTYVLGIGSAILIAVIIGFVLLLLRKR